MELSAQGPVKLRSAPFSYPLVQGVCFPSYQVSQSGLTLFLACKIAGKEPAAGFEGLSDAVALVMLMQWPLAMCLAQAMQAVRRLLATLPAEGGITFAAFRRLFMLLPSSDLLVCLAR